MVQFKKKKLQLHM